MSDRRLLRRAQWWTFLAGGGVGLVLWLTGSRAMGLGLAIGSTWSALNLRILEGLLSAALTPPGEQKQISRVFLWSAAKLGIYVSAVWLLFVAPFPVVGMALGLTVMLAALVLAGVTTSDGSTRRRYEPTKTAEEAPRRGDDVEA